MDRKIRDKAFVSLNELILRLQDEGCRKGMCEIYGSGQKILRDIPLEILLDVGFIINKNVFLEFSDYLLGKSIEDLRNELHKILMVHFIDSGKCHNGQEYVDLVGYYRHVNTIRIPHFFSWALYRAVFEDVPDDFLDICIKIPYYISVASILSRGGIIDSFDFLSLRERLDRYVASGAESWHQRAKIYLSEAYGVGETQNDQSAGALKTLQSEFEYLKSQMNEEK